jgi:hypothetical protein
MSEPTLNQLSAGFDAGRALADSSVIYGHLITDDEVRKWVAVILQAALNAPSAPAAPAPKGRKS